jgi:hypothetical protein
MKIYPIYALNIVHIFAGVTDRILGSGLTYMVGEKCKWNSCMLPTYAHVRMLSLTMQTIPVILIL